MPAPERNQWIEAWEATKERSVALREQIRDWWEAVKREPALFWQTAPVRYTTYAIGAIVCIVALRTVIGALQPAGGPTFQPRAKTALFDALCYNPECRKHFVIDRKFKFRDFPVACPFCKQETGQRALRCASDTCRGKLVMTIEEDRKIYCAECDAVLGKR